MPAGVVQTALASSASRSCCRRRRWTDSKVNTASANHTSANPTQRPVVMLSWKISSPVMNWSTGAIYLAIPIGSALLLVHLFFIARGYVRGRQFAKDDAFHPEEAVL